MHVGIKRDGLLCVRWLLMRWHNVEERTLVLPTEHPKKDFFYNCQGNFTRHCRVCDV